MKFIKSLSLIASFIFLTFNNSFAIEKITIKGGNSSGIPVLIKNVTASDIDDIDVADNIIKLTDIQLKDSKLFEFVYNSEQKSILKKFFNPLYEPDFFPFELNLHLHKDEDSNELKVTVEIFDVRRNKILIAKNFRGEENNWQRISNKISDMIFYEYTGVTGIYDSEIVFISEKGPLNNRQKRIARMDLYGSNFHYITTGKNTVLNPKFSPDGNQIYFTAYVNLRPKLYVYDRLKNRAWALTKQDHMEFSPDISNSGDTLFYTATIEGNAEIMSISLPKGKPQKITHNFAIDTSPTLSPDGRKLAFSSDRYGKNTILLYDTKNKETKRLNLGPGAYQDPAWSPDGKYLSFVRILNNKFAIGMVNISTLESKILTEGYKIESPVFAPNSKYIMFTQRDNSRISGKNGISFLFIVDLNGNIIKRVPTPTDASEADWQRIHD